MSALVLGLPVLGVAATMEARYPYDPACPWGRLANGKGMIHRCLTEQEAVSLATRAPADPTPASRSASSGEDTPTDLPPLGQKVPPFELSVGPIEADQGEITIGKLHVPIDRYRSCVEEGGGLEKEKARVVVKFLVRGERVRAEGASIESFDGVSQRTAQCIADVVDRRQVGAPSVPLTGARLTFVMTQTATSK